MTLLISKNLKKMEIEIEYFDEYIDVELYPHFSLENDSFQHEFGTEKFKSYYIVENFEIETKHTKEEIEIINKYIETNFERLEKQALKEHDKL